MKLLNRRLSITAILLVGVGGLVTLSLTAVLVVGLVAGGGNTRGLLQARVIESMAAVEALTLAHLEPAAVNAAVVARLVEAADLNVDENVVEDVRLTLRTVPQLRGVGIFIDTDNAYRIGRDQLLIHSTLHEAGIEAEDMARAQTQTGVVWGPPLWSPAVNETVVLASHPVRYGGEVRGFVATIITTSELSLYLEDLSQTDGTAFLLDSQQRVIGHPNLIDAALFGQAEVGIPEIHDIEDAILSSWVQQGGEEADILEGLEGVDAEVIEIEGAEYIVLTTTLDGVHPQRWTMGIASSTAEAEVFIDRLIGMAVIGMAVVIVTLVVLLFLARAIRRPITALATASDRIRRLELSPPPSLPSTHITELSDASGAFDRMIAALQLFESYVPRRLVFRIMRDGSDAGLLPRNREVTVLFTDIPGFTSLSETLDANQVSDLLNHHFSLIAECVDANDGTIDKYIGDSVMAFWGAPSRQNDHAVLALQTVRAIAEKIHADNAKRSDEGLPPIRVRIGLHSGPALAGNIGAPGRINYTLVGDTVNAANRLEQLGKEIDRDAEVIALASGDTVEDARQASGSDGAVDLGRMSVVGERTLRGRATPVTVYRVI